MNITGFHNGQPIVDSIPDGWRIDKWSGSPLHGYVYIHNGQALSKRMLTPCPCPICQAAKSVADHAITADKVKPTVKPTVKQFSLLNAWIDFVYSTGNKIEFLDGTRNDVVVD